MNNQIENSTNELKIDELVEPTEKLPLIKDKIMYGGYTNFEPTCKAVNVNEIVEYIKGNNGVFDTDESFGIKDKIDYLRKLDPLTYKTIPEYKKFGYNKNRNGEWIVERTYTDFKSKMKSNTLPCVCVSMICEIEKVEKKNLKVGEKIQYNAFHKNYKAHSGWFCVDIDKLDPVKLEYVLDVVKADPNVYMSFISPSRNGVKVFYEVETEYINDGVFDNEKVIHQYIFEHYVNKYKKLDIDIDESCKNLNRLCYMSYDPDIYVNERAEPEKIEINKNIILTKIEKKEKYKKSNVAERQIVNFENDILLDEFIEWLSVDNNSVAFVAKFNPYESVRNICWMLTRHFKGDKDKIKGYFVKLTKYNKDPDRPLTLLLEQNWIEKYDEEKAPSIDFLFNSMKPFGFVFDDKNRYKPEKGYDFFGYKYDKTFVIENYLTEKIKDIKECLIDGVNILKAGAGFGKSKLVETIVKEDYKNKNVLFLSIKKDILNQQYKYYVKDENFVCWRNYGEYSIGERNETGNIVFSTIQSLNKIFYDFDWDLIIVDESHLLIDYSDIDDDMRTKYILLNKLILTNVKSIYISATPEKLMVVLNDMEKNYINVEKVNFVKSDINLYYTKTPVEKTKDILKNSETNIIYINDKEKAIKLKESVFIDAILINADERGELEYIVKYEDLKTGLTYITTSILSEGINILTTGTTFNIFIIDNYTTFIENMYQLINRWRDRDIIVNYMTTPPRRGWIEKVNENGVEKEKDIDDKLYLKEKYNFNMFNAIKENKNKLLEFIKDDQQDAYIKDTVKKNIVGDRYISGDYVNRFMISNDLYFGVNKGECKIDGFMNDIKKNPLYYKEYIKYFFNIKSEIYCDEKSKKGEYNFCNIKIDEFVKDNFIKYGNLIEVIINRKLNVVNDEVEILSVIESFGIDIKVETISKFIDENKKVLKHIIKRKVELNKIIDLINDELYIDVNMNEYLYDSDIVFNKNMNKLTYIILNKTKNENLDKLNNLQKKEMNKTIEYINKNVKDSKNNKYKYVILDDVKNYMVSNNKSVKGKDWLNNLIGYMGYERDRVRISAEKTYIIKIK